MANPYTILGVFSLLALLLCGCGSKQVVKNAPPQNDTILCFGDSLVHGTGVEKAESYPVQLGAILGREVTVIGKPGQTTDEAVAKLGDFKDSEYGIIIVTLGGNDIIRRRSWEEIEPNLRTIFQTLQATGAVVVLTGVTGPLNFSRDGEYEKLCREEGVFFISEILSGILTNPDLKSDEIHPNAKGYRLMAERVAEALREQALLE